MSIKILTTGDIHSPEYIKPFIKSLDELKDIISDVDLNKEARYFANLLDILTGDIKPQDSSFLLSLPFKESPIQVERVIFNEPATIVFWADGTKTVVKTSPNDKFDKEKAILWAYMIKNSPGSKTQVQKEVAKLVESS